MWNDTLRWVRGRHTFAFGGSYERARLEELTETTKGATFNFSGDATGVALADFMLGRLRTFTHGNGTIESNRYNLFSIFAQDTFKVSSRLTLSYGVRWEPSYPWHDRYQTGEIFFPDLYYKGVTSKVCAWPIRVVRDTAPARRQWGLPDRLLTAVRPAIPSKCLPRLRERGSGPRPLATGASTSHSFFLVNSRWRLLRVAG
jgi:hypothetical protein